MNRWRPSLPQNASSIAFCKTHDSKKVWRKHMKLLPYMSLRSGCGVAQPLPYQGPN
jgi:hypothetical protein